MMRFSELGSRVARERIEMVQLWNAWSETESLRRHSFLGSMNWETRNARHYLYRRGAGGVKSLGPRSAETEGIFAAFTEGKKVNAERLKVLNEEIRIQASVLRALGAGRLPLMAARTLRALRSHRSDSVRTVGTMRSMPMRRLPVSSSAGTPPPRGISICWSMAATGCSLPQRTESGEAWLP